MTNITIHTRAGIAARISGWVGRRQRDLSDRVHAAGDAVARQHGWTVTATTGRFGFGARIYRDPASMTGVSNFPEGTGRSRASCERAIRPTENQEGS